MVGDSQVCGVDKVEVCDSIFRGWDQMQVVCVTVRDRERSYLWDIYAYLCIGYDFKFFVYRYIMCLCLDKGKRRACVCVCIRAEYFCTGWSSDVLAYNPMCTFMTHAYE